MNHCTVPDWGVEDDWRSFHDLFPTSNEKKFTPPPEDELVELLWRNGHVVMQSQTSRKPPPSVGELKQDPQLKQTVPLVNPGNNLIQENETALWFQYTLDDSLVKEFCSEFLCEEMPITDTLDANKPNKQVAGEGERNVKCQGAIIEDGSAFTMPPPKARVQLGSGGHVNFSHFARPVKADMGSLGSGNGVVVVGLGDTTSSIRTVGSSACGSNQVQNQADVSNGATRVLGKGVKEGGDPLISPQKGVQANTFDATVTSSSGGSGCSFGRTTGQQSTSNHNLKRKARGGEESECHSEDVEYEFIEANRRTQRPTSTRKSRAAEVHNLSERKRRDRINEKMRALQELIPHCNKSDKASMLDEAIEYLKSLQLQLQLMWMGSGMAPMMFPTVQQYMSRVGIGLGHASMPSINNPIQLSRAPLVNHSMPSAPSANQMPMCSSPTVNPINFPAHMQNVHLPESYARYFGLPHMQLPPQAMNLYTYGSHMVQQNQTAAVAGSSRLPTAGIPSKSIQHGHSGSKTATSRFYSLLNLTMVVVFLCPNDNWYQLQL